MIGLPSTLSGGAQVSVTEVLKMLPQVENEGWHFKFTFQHDNHRMQFRPPSIITSSSLARQIPGGFGLSGGWYLCYIWHFEEHTLILIVFVEFGTW